MSLLKTRAEYKCSTERLWRTTAKQLLIGLASLVALVMRGIDGAVLLLTVTDSSITDDGGSGPNSGEGVQIDGGTVLLENSIVGNGTEVIGTLKSFLAH